MSLLDSEPVFETRMMATGLTDAVIQAFRQIWAEKFLDMVFTFSFKAQLRRCAFTPQILGIKFLDV
jgi:hypothetical protein